ncbi:hypothetical protein HDU79_009814 [Rhizoclosmatium sp. JEL0117]|nr:hypothetical protein HDU79_009814 [Rhizoclosmatium sp. JEL0117]
MESTTTATATATTTATTATAATATTSTPTITAKDEALFVLRNSPVPTFDEITQTFDVIGACVQRGLIRDAIDVLKELMDRIVVHVEQLGLAHSRPSQATNPNLPLQNSVQDSNAVIPVPAQFWNQVNSLFLRLLVALRAESAQMDEWEWIHENVMGWIEILRWFGLVDYELGFWGQDILQAIEMGKMTCVMQRQAAEPQQQ